MLKTAIEIREKIKEKYLNGMDIKNISEEFGISDNTIRNILKEYNCYVNKFVVTEQQEKEILDLYNNGLSPTRISKELKKA